MCGGMSKPTFAYQILCQKCQWTSVTSVDKCCVKDGSEGNVKK